MVKNPPRKQSLRAAAKKSRNDQLVSRSEAETEKIAARFAKTLRGGETILLTGELGAGKTVFVRGLARGLGVRGRITSPTFVLMRVHQTATSYQPATTRASRLPATSRRRSARSLEAGGWRLAAVRYLIHVDAYRVRDARELEAIGLSEWLGRPDAVVVIEWGERAAPLIRHRQRRRIVFTSQRGDRRRIEIT